MLLAVCSYVWLDPLNRKFILTDQWLDRYNYPTDFHAGFLIHRVIQEESLYVYNMHNKRRVQT
jgi:hypothetical protein